MVVSVDDIKALREQTGAGVMHSKRALEEAGGNLEKAAEILREQGMASAAKKSGRATNEGLVEAYIHSGGRVGAIVEVNCETDFVARTPEFKALAHDVAMQVAAMSPRYLDGEELPEDERADAEDETLLRQAFIRDPSRTIQDLVQEASAKLGENVLISRFDRFALGE